MIAAALTIACVVPYLRDIRRGTTRPQRASWLVFATLAIIAAVSQAVEGARSGALLAGGAAVGFAAVSVASIRHGTGGFARPDRLALVVAACGALLSIAVSRPLVAVGAVVVAELGAVALTVRKALGDPRSETRSTWVMDVAAGILSVVAVHEVSGAELLYPVHHTVANGAVVAALIIARRRDRYRRPRWPGSHSLRRLPR